MQEKSPLVISASRRTDLVAWFPDLLCDKLNSIGFDRIHTLVIWTKDPRNILRHERLRTILSALDQIFIHLTITGLGGSDMEPGVRPADEILPMLDDLVAFVGGPERIRWRFDPIVTWEESGVRSSNMKFFQEIAPSFRNCSVINAITSICALYPKVVKRFSNQNRYKPVTLTGEERSVIREQIKKDASRLGINLGWCCEPDEQPARCINGAELTRLHPYRLPASTEPAADQRMKCECTRSWDIGWYSQHCRGRCLYCYANPAGKNNNT